MKRHAVLFSIAIAGPALAQSTGSRLPGSRSAMVATVGEPPSAELKSTAPTGRAFAAGRSMADCLVRNERTHVRGYLDAGTGADQERELTAMNRYMSLCIGAAADAGPSEVEAGFSNRTLKGLLSEAVIDRSPARTLDEVPVKKNYAASWISTDPSENVVDQMAACLADTQPALVDRLVRSAPDTLFESAALAGISPSFGSCLVRDATLHTNKSGLRLSLATALYHRMYDPAIATGADAASSRAK